MIGILVQLILSWVIIWVTERKNLSVLGFRPTASRLTGFFFFFFLSALICASGFFLKMIFGDQQWKLNPNTSLGFILSGTWWNIKSVLFEELIFRGVLLYILIKRVGSSKAMLISAAAFGIYHWFSFGVLGDPVQMIMVFFITGLMGLVLAYGYAKTFSLYIPIAIHFGWNLTQVFIFSGGPLGDGLFVPTKPGGFRTDSYLVFFVVTFLPLLLVLTINYILIRKQHQVSR